MGFNLAFKGLNQALFEQRQIKFYTSINQQVPLQICVFCTQFYGGRQRDTEFWSNYATNSFENNAVK